MHTGDMALAEKESCGTCLNEVRLERASVEQVVAVLDGHDFWEAVPLGRRHELSHAPRRLI